MERRRLQQRLQYREQDVAGEGTEALEGEGSCRQFPFYEEMRHIFSGRMQRLLSLEKQKGVLQEEEELQAQQNQETDGGRRENKIRRAKINEGDQGALLVLEELEWALMELARRRREREKRWLYAAEAREAERRAAELEWRAAVDAVSGERAEMETRWREMREERRERDEIRAERLDSVISAIVARLDGNEDDDEGG
ncbi:Trihelix transcription factor GT-3b [Platanthera guangdongensis]|uniref:Trihelix transcription factor GT-3b n=1 Tax=Platanthera guangdongensis TaxID=2320717 RepID=A0ABR2N593_9ASPA